MYYMATGLYTYVLAPVTIGVNCLEEVGSELSIFDRDSDDPALNFSPDVAAKVTFGVLHSHFDGFVPDHFHCTKKNHDREKHTFNAKNTQKRDEIGNLFWA